MTPAQWKIFQEAPRYRGFYRCDLWCGYVHDTEKGRAKARSLKATHFDPLTFHRLDPGGKPALSLWGCFFYKFRARRAFREDVFDYLRWRIPNLEDDDVCAFDCKDGHYDLYLSPRLFSYKSALDGLPETYEAFARQLASDLSAPGAEVRCIPDSLIPVDREDILSKSLSFGPGMRTLFQLRKPHPRKPLVFPRISALINERGEIGCGMRHANDGVKCAVTLESRLSQKRILEFTQRDALRAVDGTFALGCGVEEALRILVAIGHIVECPDLSPKSNGRRSTWFLVNPEVLRQGGASIYDGSMLIPHELVGKI